MTGWCDCPGTSEAVMMRVAPVFVLSLLAACSTPPVATSGEVPPPVAHVESVRVAGARPERGVAPTDNGATDAWLAAQVEELRRREDAERDHQLAVARAGAPMQVVYRERVVRERVHGDPVGSFPWNTALGATTGAIIGAQSCDTAEGALIGGSIGLFLDLCRWY